MRLAFQEYLSKWLNNIFHFMSASCCAPSIDNKYDLAFETAEEFELSETAKTHYLTKDLSDNETEDEALHHNDLCIDSKNMHSDLLLVSGYIHQIAPQQLNVFAYKDVLHLCSMYYHTHQRRHHQIILLTELSTNASFPCLDFSDDDDDEQRNTSFMDTQHLNFGGASIANIPTNTTTDCKIYELDTPNKLSLLCDDWMIKFAAMCSTKNIVLPPMVHRQLSKQYLRKIAIANNTKTNSKIKAQHILNDYSVIFKLCGSGKSGWSDTCSAIVIDDHSSQLQSLSGRFGFNWHLPEYPNKTGGSAAVFSLTYGLIVCGGYKSNSCYRLPLDTKAYFEQTYDWIWHPMPCMNEIRWFPSCAVINDEQLICLAGSSADHEPLKTVEVFNFEHNEWSQHISPFHHPRKLAGIYWDSSSQLLYIGGGDHATNSVEFLDVAKNQWFELPATNFSHKYYPNLWTTEKHPNLLYISCSYSNSIESLDLRANDKWNVLCADNLFDSQKFVDLEQNQIRALM